MELEKELATARELACRAGATILEHYAEKTAVQWKGTHDPVTAADRAASALLVGELKRRFPADGILSEEEPDDLSRLGKARVWIIDPLDGTQEFIARRAEFAVMIGLAVEGVARLGVIYQPSTEKLYYAASGTGAFLVERGVSRPLHVAAETNPARMCMALSRSHNSPQVDFIRTRLGISKTVRSGSIGLKVGLICTGRAHLYLHTGRRTFQWDTCAPEALLHEAGGQMTDLSGDPLCYNTFEPRNLHGIIASNGAMHAEIVSVVTTVQSGFI